MTSIKEMKTEELQKNLEEKQEALRKIRFDINGSKGRNVKEVRETRREIARMLTELNGRNMALNK
jgi:ribosomal protein L29